MAPQDFIKGWPHPDLLEGSELRAALLESFAKGLERSGQALNYGDAANGGYMLGHPAFREGLAKFLQEQYGETVDPKMLMSTGGASMGTDLICRAHCKHGEYAVVEEPTYYLSFTTLRDQGLNLLGVPMQEDGMDVDALEKHLEEHPGKIKLVYTVCVHHNPTGITLSNAKRERLLALAKKHRFVIAADEAYQLLNFEPSGVKPLFYHDDPADPRVLCIGTLSKLIGPGIKVGWVHAHESLLKPLANVGFVDSGNNPVTFASISLLHFIESGKLAKHISLVSKELSEKCELLCRKLREVGLEVVQPKGGYFVWVKSKGKMTGRSGECMCIGKDRFADWMRLCFAWLPRDKIVEGIEYLRE